MKNEELQELRKRHKDGIPRLAFTAFASIAIVSVVLNLLGASPPLVLGILVIMSGILVQLLSGNLALRIANDSLKRANHKSALLWSTRSIRMMPIAPAGYITASASYIGLGDYDAAMEKCDTALALDPKGKMAALAYNNRAFAHLRQGKCSEALKDITESLALDGKFKTARVNHCLILAACHQYEDALTAVGHAMLDLPKEGSLWLVRSHCLAGMRRFDDAIETIKRASTLVKGASDLIVPWCRSEINCELRLADSAIADLSDITSRRPTVGEAFINRAHAFSLAKNTVAARADLDHARDLQLSPTGMGLLLACLATIDVLDGKLESALENSRQAQFLYPESSAVTAVRGAVLHRNGEYEEALAFLSNAIEQNEYCAEAYWFRSEAYRHLHMESEALLDEKRSKMLQYIPYY